ncbi:MAG: hypothetical protein IT294_02615 [Deltaproteobacteria bacterium]|nr:hypothetical protein [Deltaproteobacteria bacterium]
MPGRAFAIAAACALVAALGRCPCPPAEAAHATEAHVCCDPGAAAPERDSVPPVCPQCTPHAPVFVAARARDTTAAASRLPLLLAPTTAGPVARLAAPRPGSWTAIPHGPSRGHPAVYRVLRL